MGKPFSKEKKSLFLPILSDFLLLAKKFGRFAKPAIYVSCIGGSFCGKTFFENFSIFSNFSHSFGVWSTKPLVGKILSGLSQLQSALLEALFGEKSVFFEKNNNCSSVLEFEHFFCLLTKKVRVSKKRPTNIEKIGGKNL